MVVAQSVIALDMARQHWYRWIQPHGFLERVETIGQIGKICCGGCSLAKHGIHFPLDIGSDHRLLRDDCPQPRHGIGSGFMAGDKHRHGFVAQFIIGQRLTSFLVGCLHQHLQQIHRLLVG